MAGTHSVDGHSCCHGHFFLMAIFPIPFSEWVSKSQSTSSLSNVVWMFPLSIYRDIHIISVLCAYWAPSISLIQSKSNYLLFFFDCDFMIVCFNKLHIIISSFGFRVYAVWAISCMALSLRSSRIILLHQFVLVRGWKLGIPVIHFCQEMSWWNETLLLSNNDLTFVEKQYLWGPKRKN